MRWQLYVLASFTLVVAFVSKSALRAETVTLYFTGVVASVTEGGPPEFPRVGDPVTGSISYDLAAPDSEPRFDTGRYDQQIPSGYVVTAGKLQVTMNDYRLSVYNKVPGEGPWDGMDMSGESAGLFGSSGPTLTNIGFSAFDRNILSSASLPETLDLSLLPNVQASGVILDRGLGEIWRVDFALHHLSNNPVPEPSCLALAGIGAALLVTVRSTFRRSR